MRNFWIDCQLFDIHLKFLGFFRILWDSLRFFGILWGLSRCSDYGPWFLCSLLPFIVINFIIFYYYELIKLINVESILWIGCSWIWLWFIVKFIYWFHSSISDLFSSADVALCLSISWLIGRRCQFDWIILIGIL